LNSLVSKGIDEVDPVHDVDWSIGMQYYIIFITTEIYQI